VSHAAAVALSREDVTLPATSPWAKLPLAGSAVSIVGLLLCLALGRGEAAKQLYFSWLVAFVFFFSIAIGCLYFLLIHQATQAGWGVVVRRFAENAAATLPLFAILFLPIAFGLRELYPWARQELVDVDHLLQHKKPYLNASFFFIRAAVAFLVWSGLAWWFLGMSRGQDERPDPSVSARMRRWSAPALIPLALLHTLTSFDWLMSLDPHWYSTIFGVYVFSGSFMAAFAFLALVVIGLQKTGLLRETVTTEHFHDLGKLLFAFTVFWAYIGFSQFFLIWYGNIPEETIWFRHRMHGSWTAVSLLLAIGHFGIPFFFLMPRSVKRNPRLLAIGAGWMLLMHLVDVHWIVMPSLHDHGVGLSVLDLAALLAVGGAFVAAFGALLRRHALVPLGDPRLPESLGFENI
jgi:hypothetical protein